MAGTADRMTSSAGLRAGLRKPAPRFVADAAQSRCRTPRIRPVDPQGGIDADGLARASGSSPERVARLAELGVLEPVDGRFRRSDIHRVRLAELLAPAGVLLADPGG